MSYHWIYTLGSKACVWTGMLAAPVWPQTPCNIDESWNMGYVIVGIFVMLTVYTFLRRLNAWQNYYRR